MLSLEPIKKVGKRSIELNMLRVSKIGTLSTFAGKPLTIVGIGDGTINEDSIIYFRVNGNTQTDAKPSSARIFCFKRHRDILSAILEDGVAASI